MKYFVKVLISILLLAASVFCFVFPEKTISQKEYQVTTKQKTVEITENDGLKKLLEYAGLFLLVITAWQWRKELGFDSFGFISKQPEISGTDPDDRENDVGDIPLSLPSIASKSLPKELKPTAEQEYMNFNFQEKLKEIIAILEDNPNSITNARIIAHKLGVTKQTADRYLFELLKNNVIRKDTYPGSRSSVYSLVKSSDNRVIEYFLKEIIEKDENVIGDYRYVRLKSKYEIDAIIKTERTNYVIELKYKTNDFSSVLNHGIKQLIKIEEHINLEPLELILIIVMPRQKKKSIEKQSFIGKRNLKIHIIEEEILATFSN